LPYPDPPPQPADRSIGVFWIVVVVLGAIGLLAPFLLQWL
jgi:hypothetical protein